MPEPTDIELWHRIRDDDPDAFGLLFERHGPMIHRYAVRRAEPALADDVVSLVFLEVWRRRKQVELQRPTALPWLYGIASNVLRTQGRTRRRHDQTLERLATLASPSPTLIERQVEIAAEADSVVRQISTLPRRYREVLMLSTLEHLSHAEIAEALDIGVGTVKSRLSRARARLERDAPHHPVSIHDTVVALPAAQEARP